METQTVERIAAALEQIVEKLGAIEVKIEELSYEIQAQGTVIVDALNPGIAECDN
jgi:hypothetical protein